MGGAHKLRLAGQQSKPSSARLVGRPSLYTEGMAALIATRKMDGCSLRTICDAADMPHRVTVLRWQERRPDFAARCARAREVQADLMDDRILDVAERCLAGTLDPQAAKAAIKDMIDAELDAASAALLVQIGDLPAAPAASLPAPAKRLRGGS